MTLVECIRQDAKSAKWIGVLLVIAGILSLVAPLGAGLSIAITIGVLMLVSGVAQFFLVLRAGSIGRGILLAVLALLSIVTGGYMALQPGLALAVLTLFLAGYLLAAGLIEIVGAFGARPAQGWGWLLMGGLVSALLGLMIWRQFPLSGVWAIGVLVGVRLLVSGTALIAIAGSVKEAATPDA